MFRTLHNSKKKKAAGSALILLSFFSFLHVMFDHIFLVLFMLRVSHFTALHMY